MEEKRAQWKTRFGFIMAAAGSAVGLGNIWRFPYLVGKHGGGAFVLLYLVLLALLGLPLLKTELFLGRKTGKNAVGTFKKLAPGTAWQGIGWMGIASGFLVLSYYSVISGWSLSYFVKSINGSYMGADTEILFNSYTATTIEPIAWHLIFMILTTVIIGFGVVKGIEKISKILMPAIFVIILILIFRSLTLPGGMEGLKFYLAFDFSKLGGEAFLDALGQVFFTLSLGMGTMITYGSYMKKDEDITKSSLQIILSDTVIAILAGFAIFPAVFSFGLEPSSGPGLTFVTLPAVFSAMDGIGRLFGALFFLLLGIAALTSAVSMLEVVVAYFIDEKKWSRMKATVTTGIIIALVGIPASLGFGILSKLTFFGKNIQESYDFLATNILLVLGSLLTAIFIGWKSWNKNTLKEINLGAGKLKSTRFFEFDIKFIAPILISIVFLHAIGLF